MYKTIEVKLIPDNEAYSGDKYYQEYYLIFYGMTTLMDETTHEKLKATGYRQLVNYIGKLYEKNKSDTERKIETVIN